METLADRVNLCLKEKGWSGYRLAQEMGLQYGTIQSLTSGRSATFKYLPELARALDKTCDYLLTGQENTQLEILNKANKDFIDMLSNLASKEAVDEKAPEYILDHVKKAVSAIIGADANRGGLSEFDFYVSRAKSLSDQLNKEKK